MPTALVAVEAVLQAMGALVPDKTIAEGSGSGVRFSMRTDQHALAPQGIDGDHPGGTSDCIINPGGEDERSLPSRFGDQRLKTGDVLRVERPGGGGVGAAFERSPEAVLEDVRQGYVSVEQARSDYGVVVRAANDEVTLDPDATRELRLASEPPKQ